mmetsp:Transcript_31704/g.57397  ORF Transcript_31704/g.57397 Transcript_31704/m.57397 type:complete len:246 (+) Transcript_31704:173-910(+)
MKFFAILLRVAHVRAVQLQHMTMGTQHSTPVPNEDDWLFEHGPPSPPLSSALPPKQKGDTYDFCMLKNSWNTKKRNAIQEQLGLEFRLMDSQSCLVLYNDEPLVVLQEAPQKRIYICSFTPATTNQSSCGSFQDSPLYKWAVVSKRKESHQFDMTTKSDGAVYASEFYGRVLGKRKVLLLRTGLICATMERRGNFEYKCRVGPGIDPVLVACFVACRDEIHKGEMKILEEKSYILPRRPDLVFHS